MINLLVAEAINKPSTTKEFKLERGFYHIFESNGDYRDSINLVNTHKDFINSLGEKYKRCLFVHGYAHKDEWRHEWTYFKADGTVTTGIDFDGDYTNWTRVIDPKKRKPWYWDRKLTTLKAELPNWRTCPQEACNMRIEAREILNELESNFNINNNYYRIQSNSALEAHSIVLECDSCIDDFERELENMTRRQDEREANGWNDDHDDTDY